MQCDISHVSQASRLVEQTPLLFTIVFIVAGYTVLTYDILLTIGVEIQYVWLERQFLFSKLAYGINRYGMVCLSMLYLFSEFSRLHTVPALTSHSQ